MSASLPSSPAHAPFFRPGFLWTAADAYLFDIDGTLLNSRDAVHYRAFQSAARSVCAIEAGIEGLPIHGNTDPLILRAALGRASLSEEVIADHLPQLIQQMCLAVERNSHQLSPELCPGITELLVLLEKRGKMMGIVSGNLEAIGWAKLERAGLKGMFAFGSFSWPRETRAEIFSHGVDLARQKLGPSAKVYVVGDTPSDIRAARMAEVPVIALATGVYSFPELLAAAPDACLNSAFELFAALAETAGGEAIPPAM
ncbi:MAG TPA: HAD family hydrolase [Candidatus Angelobacter sp.]|nr:HAD family hydrolase [Candidatus Angelobacter sp.]